MSASLLKFLSHFLVLLSSLWLWGGATFGQSPDEFLAVELISDHSHVSAGTHGWLGVRVKLSPNWHVYWKNSGESGYPTSVTWDAPSGIEIEPLEYPAPHLYTYDGLSGYILKDEFCLLAPFRISSGSELKKKETLQVKGVFDALVCNESTCLPFSKQLSISLKVQNKPLKRKSSAPHKPLNAAGVPHSFAERVGFSVLKAIPDYPPAEFQAKATGSGNRVSLIFPSAGKFLPDPSKAFFFPENSQFSFSHKDISADGALKISFSREEGDRDTNPAFLAGVLTHPDLEIPWRLNLAIDEAETDAEPSVFNVDQDSVGEVNNATVSSVSSFNTLLIMFGLVIIGMSAWAYGKSISAPSDKKKKWQAFSLAVFLIGIWVGYPTAQEDEQPQSLTWQAWSQQKQDQLVEQGRPVYVDFTAKWCLSCQVNKRVYSEPEVMRAILDQDIALLRADWTKRGSDILQALQSYDREGVPLNIFYPGNKSDPVILPEILTKDSVLHAFDGKNVLSSNETELSFMVLIGFAWLGGLILNLMPCVFPVIGLKIMSFVKQAGEDSSQIMRYAWVFVAGVVLSFWVLLGILLFLREGLQQQVGWGFQLQEPAFVFALAVILFLFALNLSGVFEIGMRLTGAGSSLTQRSGLSGSFFSGVLATVVATPCMAPFLGVAVGTALTMDNLPAFTVFTSIALGLASPYLILSLFPQWLSHLPKPGAWMETFKQFLAFPLYGTVVWLIWTLAALL
jgi:DsbC/DsbD-like thiol-disulfide interchange protein/cytochrome c biogenesis protein CcdA